MSFMEQSFVRWRDQLPPGFALSVKAPRGLTHAKKLYSPEAWVDRLVACWHELGDKRAVLLVQLHPGHARDDARLDWFLGRLPWWVPVAVELRHATWQHDDVFALLERHRSLLREAFVDAAHLIHDEDGVEDADALVVDSGEPAPQALVGRIGDRRWGDHHATEVCERRANYSHGV